MVRKNINLTEEQKEMLDKLRKQLSQRRIMEYLLGIEHKPDIKELIFGIVDVILIILFYIRYHWKLFSFLWVNEETVGVDPFNSFIYFVVGLTSIYCLLIGIVFIIHYLKERYY